MSASAVCSVDALSTSYMLGGVPPTPPHQASLPEAGTVPAGVQGKGVPGMGERSGGLPDDGEREKHIQGPLRGPAQGPAPRAYALPTVLRVLITLPLNVCYKWSLMPRSWSRAQSSCPPFPCLSVALSSAGWRPGPHQSYTHTHTHTHKPSHGEHLPQWELEFREAQGQSRMPQGVSG